MKKQHISLLLILIAIAFVLVAGCTSPTQNNVAPTTTNLTTNTSTSASTTASSTVSPKPTSSSSPSPSATTPSSTPTSTPTPSSGKIATSITGNGFFNSNPTVTRGSSENQWAFNLVSQQTGLSLCGVPLTAMIDGHPAGTLTSQNGPGCFSTANYALSAQETTGLSVGQHTLTISFAGDNTYQPTKQDFPIEVT